MKSLPRAVAFFSFVIALTTFSSFMFPHEVSASSCGLLPNAPQSVNARSGPGPGQVTISWASLGGAGSYAVVYGTKSNTYNYGGDPIGNSQTTWNTISSLQPGATYYFRLIGKQNDCASPWSSEVSAVAMSTANTMAPVMVSEPVGQPAGQSMMGPQRDGPVGKNMLWAKSGPGTGQVTMYWKDADSANDYHLMYGTGGSYQYGALNIGNIHSFTVKSLAAGKTYSFALVPLLNGRALYTTPAVTVAAMAPQETTAPVMEAPPVGQPESMMPPVQAVVEPQTDNQQTVQVQESPMVMQEEPVTAMDSSPAMEVQPTTDQQTVTVQDAPMDSGMQGSPEQP